VVVEETLLELEKLGRADGECVTALLTVLANEVLGETVVEKTLLGVFL